MENQLITASKLLGAVKLAKFRLLVELQPENLERVFIPDGSALCIEGSTESGNVVVSDTTIKVVDANGDPIRPGIPILKLNNLFLKHIKNSSDAFNVFVSALFLWCIPIRFKVNKHSIPANLEDLIQWATSLMPGSTVDAKSEVSEKSDGDKRRSIKFEASFSLAPGTNFELNNLVKLNVASEQESKAEITIHGDPGYIQATVNGTNVSLETDQFTTGPSDIDAKFTLNRNKDAENRLHIISIQSAVLRKVQFKVSDMPVPELGVLRLSGSEGEAGEKTYDFIITIDPANPFTYEDLYRVLMERVNDPATVRRLQNKLKESASSASVNDDFELKIDSTRWNIVDYATHDLRGQLKLILDTPHIRADYDDLGIAEHVKKSQPHFLAFLTAFDMQHASQYDQPALPELIHRALSVDTLNELYDADGNAAGDLLRELGLSHDDGINLRSNSPSTGIIDRVISTLDTPGVPAKIAVALVRAGNVLNNYERKILRNAWIAAGGMKRSGRLYVMMMKFAEQLRTQLLADERAPTAVKAMAKNIPTGEALQAQVLRGSDNLRGIIWVGQNVLPDGWGIVSERLESHVARYFGGGKPVERVGSTIFNTQTAETTDEETFKQVHMRYVADGEEFFQQLYKLLEDTQAAMADSEAKGCVASNYWSFEAFTDPKSGPNKWGLRIAAKLEEMALDGFTVSIVVNGQNNPGYRGVVRFREITQNVEQNGKGHFLVHNWMPAESHFPLGTHVKYTVTPLGVICGGSNISDHYAHWSDTNIMLFGKESIITFAKHHEAILAEQNEVGSGAPVIERIEPYEGGAEWTPLDTYEFHGHPTGTFQSQSESVGMRVFRDHGGDENDRILVEHIAVLDSARPGHTVYITQCYYVTPQPFDAHPLARAVMRALGRGVNVEILTNSYDSIDVKQTAGPVIKACFLTLKHARRLGDNAGTFTVHLPSAEYVSRNEHEVPEVLIHDKLMFYENISLVSTHNFHPRSFTMEQELLTEVIGPAQPDQEFEYERLLETATNRFNTLIKKKGGDRVGSVSELMAPIMWNDEEAPILWGPAAYAYIQFQEKKWLYCNSYTSGSAEEVTKVEEMLDTSTSASLLDLAMNVF